MMLQLEGLICVALISPLFAALGAVGGLIMGAACRLGRHVRQTLQAIALLPVVILFGESGTPLPTQVHVVHRTISIPATPEQIWPHLLQVEDIDADRFLHAWAFRIGVPVPVSAVISEREIPMRRVHMAKQVYFDQVAVELIPNRRIRWKYRFYEDSFPAGAMDDHVRIGGRYFDLLDTQYTLRVQGDTTRLEVAVRYRLSTRFNWYAGPVVDRLMKDAADAYLDLYRSLSEGIKT
jgi:hypothetical protein